MCSQGPQKSREANSSGLVSLESDAEIQCGYHVCAEIEFSSAHADGLAERWEVEQESAMTANRLVTA